MGLRYSFKRSRPKRRYRTKQPRFIPSSSTTPQAQGMLFTPRTLGNPLSISERKYFDSEVSSRALTAVTGAYTTAMADPTTVNTLFAPVPGTGVNQRIGRKCTVLSLRIRGEIEIPGINDSASIAALSGIIFRFIVVIDKQTNGVQMQSQDLITSGGSNVAWDMYQNTAGFGRFRVLKDRRFLLQDPNYGGDPATTTLDRNGRAILFEYTFKFRRGLVVHFNAGTAGSVGDITDNSLHVSCAVNTITANPTLSYKSRVTYLDS